MPEVKTRVKRFIRDLAFVPPGFRSSREKLVFRTHHLKGMVLQFIGLKRGGVNGKLSTSAEEIGATRIKVGRLSDKEIPTKMYTVQLFKDKWGERKRLWGSKFKKVPELVKLDKVMSAHLRVVQTIYTRELIKRAIIKERKGLPRIPLSEKIPKEHYKRLEQSVDRVINNMYAQAKKRHMRNRAKRAGTGLKKTDAQGRISPGSKFWIEFDTPKK